MHVEYSHDYSLEVDLQCHNLLSDAEFTLQINNKTCSYTNTNVHQFMRMSHIFTFK